MLRTRSSLKGFLNIKEKLIKWGFATCGAIAAAVLIGIFFLLVAEGWPAIKAVGLSHFFDFVLWRPDGYNKQSFGLWPAIEGTFLTTIVALLISVPLGIGTSCYLSFLSSERLREWLKPMFELMATIPSVVIGFIGLVVTGPMLANISGRTNGLNALNGALLLALMSLPTIISVSEDALQNVSRDIWRGSLALGATRFRTIMAVMPAAITTITATMMIAFLFMYILSYRQKAGKS